MDKKEIIRKQVNDLLGREVSEAEFQGIDFSGAIEDLEPSFDDLSHSMISPIIFYVGTGMACILMGINDALGVLGIACCALILSVVLGWACIRRKKLAVAKEEILKAIKICEERNKNRNFAA